MEKSKPRKTIVATYQYIQLNIPLLVQEVEEVFQNLEKEIDNFKQCSGLHCKPGCGKCCLKPDIEATILEFIPFAVHLYENGKAMVWLEKLSQQESSICAILDSYSTGPGHCSSYSYRGLICRLFGFSARSSKYGQRELVTCTTIKNEQPEAIQRISMGVKGEARMPLMSDYYMQLRSIDSGLPQEFYPINRAIKKAIETVLHYYAYRKEK